MKRRSAFLSGLLALSVVAAACGGDDSDDSSAGTTAAGGASVELTGEINISGSSTVEPISQRVKELFNDEQPDVAITVAGPGTGDGFKVFCAGETDISDASRPIKEEEAAACKTAGVEYVELKVGFDGLTVVTDPKNTAVECLNKNDLYALIGPESQGFKKWSDAQTIANELGSKTKLPDAALSITAPGAESGTYDSFIEIVTEPVAKKRVEATKLAKGSEKTIRKDYNPSSDDNVIIKNIEGTANSLGWVGFAFASEQGDKINSIAVDSGKGCVEPSAETIADATYPLSRALYIYVNTKKAAENPALVGYVDYYLGAGYEAVEEVGYVALPEAELAKTADAWAAVAR